MADQLWLFMALQGGSRVAQSALVTCRNVHWKRVHPDAVMNCFTKEGLLQPTVTSNVSPASVLCGPVPGHDMCVFAV